MTGPEPYGQDDGCPSHYGPELDCQDCLTHLVTTLTAAREENARLREFHDKHEACIDALTDDYHKSVEQTLNRADQAEQRVRELQRDLSDTTAECELRAETIAAYWDERVKLEQRLAESAAPIPMLLSCPWCSRAHVDGDVWATRPHRTHLCEYCGNSFRPSNHATVGVTALPPKPAAGGEGA